MNEATPGHLAEVLEVQARIEAVKINVHGMLAENYQRQQAGQALAYNESDFTDAEVKILKLSNELSKLA